MQNNLATAKLQKWSKCNIASYNFSLSNSIVCVRVKLPQSSIVDIISSHAAGPYRVYLLTYKVGYDRASSRARISMCVSLYVCVWIHTRGYLLKLDIIGRGEAIRLRVAEHGV